MTHKNLMGGRLRRAVLAAVALTAVGTVRADYVWLQTDGGQLVARVGELRKPLSPLPALQDARSVAADGKATPLQAKGDAWALPAGGGDVRVSAARVGGDGSLAYYQARFGRQDTKAVNDLELVPTEPGGNAYRLVFKGKPVAASQVLVDTSEGWRRTLTPGPDGSVTFVPYFPGLYVLEVSARVNNASVTVDGKNYTDVRYTATLSFEVAR